jgi:hypothetical protein
MKQGDTRGLSRLLLGIAVLLTACSTPGPRFSEHPAGAAPVPVDTAGLVVFNTADPDGFNWCDATVLIDGKESGVIGCHKFKVFQVTPGKHQVAARMQTWPGLCEKTIEVSDGSRYFLEVSLWLADSSRAEEFARGTLYAFSVANPFLFPFALVAHQGYLAVEAARNACGGFSIELVDEATARPKLEAMRAAP